MGKVSSEVRGSVRKEPPVNHAKRRGKLNRAGLVLRRREKKSFSWGEKESVAQDFKKRDLARKNQEVPGRVR